MTIEETTKKVDMLLTDRGLGGEYQEQAVRLLLYHLFVAVDIYQWMTVAERNKAGWWYRTFFRHVFSLTGFLKERKRKREKEKSPLHPSYKKDSGVVEKAKKTPSPAKRDFSSFEERKEAFRKAVFTYEKIYDNRRLLDFYNWFSQPNKQRTKMRFEKEEFWDLGQRLERWMGNSFSSADNAAAIRLESAKKRQKKEASEGVAEQQVVAAEREAYNARQEQEIAERKAGAVSYEEFQRMKAEGKI